MTSITSTRGERSHAATEHRPGRRRIFGLLPPGRPMEPAGKSERVVGYLVWLLLAGVLLWSGT